MFYCISFGWLEWAVLHRVMITNCIALSVKTRVCAFTHAFADDDPPAHFRLSERAVTTTQLSQQQAATSLGYTQASWDNTSGNEPQPASASTKWTALTAQDRLAATVLGYTEQTWRTVSVMKKTPWSDLTVTAGADMRCNSICFVCLDWAVLHLRNVRGCTGISYITS